MSYSAFHRFRLGPAARFLLMAGIWFSVGTAEAITLTGANGKSVEFHRIESATPKGLAVKMVADGPLIGIPWEKLDLAALERDHPEIHSAHLRAAAGETVVLGLEGSGGAPGAAAADPAKAPQPRYPGWSDVKIGKVEYMLQMPSSKPRGILLLSLDDFGDAFRYVQTHERGSGVWGVFQSKFDMALLTYDTDDSDNDPTRREDFMFPEKGSGKALLSALAQFESKLKMPGLADLPIAIFATGRSGTAFAYNFLHQHPGRILAASLYDGGFYDAEPTAESVKVPVLFMWGQYSNRPKLWHSENDSVTALAKAAPLKSVWTNAREFRGRGEPNAVVDHFGKQYLISMVEARLPEKVTPPPPAPAEGATPAAGGEAPAAAPVGGTAPAPPAAGGGDAPAETPAPEPVPEGPPVLRELDRSAGSIGNNLTGEVLGITDPEVVTGPDESFIPNATVTRYWKGFVLGELEAPIRGKVQ